MVHEFSKNPKKWKDILATQSSMDNIIVDNFINTADEYEYVMIRLMINM